MAKHNFVPIALLALVGTGLAQQVDGSDYDRPAGGPPASYFTAATTIPVAALQTAAAKASRAALDATFPINFDRGAAKSTIYKDWSSFSAGAAFVWVADMDVDCDGLDYECKGNPDGLPETNFGALAAYEVPFIVIPDRFGTTYKKVLPGNNIGAVICDGKMFYGVYGDSDGDTPQVIGEASWLMARTCFPDEDLNGNNGHTEADVTYILFTGSDSVLPTSALNENYITNFSTLRVIGDKLMTALAKNLNLRPGSPTTTTSASGSSPTGMTISWERQCLGNTCENENGHDKYLVCKGANCAEDEDSHEREDTVVASDYV